MRKTNFSEFKNKTQEERKQKKINMNFLDRYILRFFSVRISFILFKLFKNINGNHITTFSLFYGIAALFLFSFSENLFWVIGGILFFTFHILDCVDGEMARATNTFSESGGKFDNLVHQYLNGFFLFFTGLGLYNFTGSIYILYLTGIAIVFSMTTVILWLLEGIILKNKGIKKKKRKDYKKIKYIQNPLSLTGFIKSFFGFVGISILITVLSVIDFIFGFFYLKLLFCLVLYIYLITVNIKHLYRFVTNPVLK